jgi:Do/DeqQ family serine protease
MLKRLGITALLILGISACQRIEVEKKPYYVAEGEKREAPTPHLETLLSTQEAFMSVAEKVTPSVVNISTVQRIPGGVRRFPFEIDPFFRDFFEDFFGGILEPERRSMSLGSGVIINPDGDILTNYHVIKDAEEITVKLSDKSEYRGKLVGADPKTDLAVIKISSNGKHPYATLGDSDKIKVGQWAIAIGNPFGLDRTFTVGVISATGRAEVGVATYESFIQTDASINPGNSGGPLLNIHGEVIGINTAIVAAGQGIGFAIPVNMAKGVISDLIKKGKVTRGWLGVGIQPLTRELAESFGLSEAKGALVNEVFPGSPAEKAGIKPGDIIVRFDGKDVEESRSLQNLVGSTKAGTIATVDVIREKMPLSVKVKIEEMPEEEGLATRAPEGMEDWLGLTVRDIPQEMKDALDIEEGVLVKDVREGSYAERGGIQRGDMIIAVNREKVADAAEYKRVVSAIKRGSTISFLVRREGVTLYLAFKTRR